MVRVGKGVGLRGMKGGTGMIGMDLQGELMVVRRSELGLWERSLLTPLIISLGYLLAVAF